MYSGVCFLLSFLVSFIFFFQLQQEEEELIRKRAANSTALAAIGPRKKRKLDEAIEGTSSSLAQVILDLVL